MAALSRDAITLLLITGGPVTRSHLVEAASASMPELDTPTRPRPFLLDAILA